MNFRYRLFSSRKNIFTVLNYSVSRLGGAVARRLSQTTVNATNARFLSCIAHLRFESQSTFSANCHQFRGLSQYWPAAYFDCEVIVNFCYRRRIKLHDATVLSRKISSMENSTELGDLTARLQPHTYITTTRVLSFPLPARSWSFSILF
jgi:Protein of unknown function (DUF1175)